MHMAKRRGLLTPGNRLGAASIPFHYPELSPRNEIEPGAAGFTLGQPPILFPMCVYPMLGAESLLEYQATCLPVQLQLISERLHREYFCKSGTTWPARIPHLSSPHAGEQSSKSNLRSYL